MNKIEDMSVYDSNLHRLGRISTSILILLLASVPVLLGIIFDVQVNIVKTLTIIMGVAPLFIIVGVVDFFSIVPVLGVGASYLGFITGNTLNMKVPAAISSIKVSQFEPGTKQADIVAMIAVAVSAIVTMVIVFISMLFISSLLPVIQSPALAPAFENVMPALLGALSVPIFRKDIKTAIVPCILVAILTLVLGYSMITKYEIFAIPVMLLVALGWKYIQYKKSNIEKATK